MNYWRIIPLLAIITAAGVLLAGQGSKRYSLSADNRSIMETVAGKAPKILIDATDLPDTVPEAFPRSTTMRFNNSKFNFISVAPNDQQILFCSGDPDGWIGLYLPQSKQVKFLNYGYQSRFFDAIWHGNSKYLAYGLIGPDKRLLLHIIRVPTGNEIKPEYLNAWQAITDTGESLLLGGFGADKDTSFSFDVIKPDGSVSGQFKIPLRRPPTPKTGN